MIYEIAGLKVEMNPKFDRLLRQSEQYKSSGEPIMRLNPSGMRDYSSLCNCSEEYREYICSSAEFCRRIIKHGRFFLHASAVVLGGKAYLFSAPTGTGKSTHTALWLKKFPGSYILNDDKPVIFPKNGGISVFGTPFSGKTDLNINREVPLQAICFLSRSEENGICGVTEDRAIAHLLDNTYRPRSTDEMNLLLNMLGEVVESVGIYEMHCTMDEAAAELAHGVMKG